jgi:hypothetical protein
MRLLVLLASILGSLAVLARMALYVARSITRWERRRARRNRQPDEADTS